MRSIASKDDASNCIASVAQDLHARDLDASMVCGEAQVDGALSCRYRSSDGEATAVSKSDVAGVKGKASRDWIVSLANGKTSKLCLALGMPAAADMRCERIRASAAVAAASMQTTSKP